MGKEAKKTSFVKQAAILAAAGIIVRVFGFLYRLPLTDMIGDEGNGIYSAGFYLYNFFLVMSSAGLPVAISKIVSERVSLGRYRNAKRVFRVSLFVSGSLGLFCSILMFAGAKWFCGLIQSPRSYYAILTLSPTVFIVSVMSVYRGYFQGLNTTVPTAVSQIVEQIFNALFSVLLAWLWIGMGVEFGAAGGTAGTGIGALAGLMFLIFAYWLVKDNINKRCRRDRGGYKIESNLQIVITLIKTAVPIIMGTAIFSMTNLIDMKMVNSRLAASGAFNAEQIDALYGQLTGKYVTLSTLPVSISTALATAIIPSIASSVVRKDYSAVKEKISTTLRLTMIISIPAAFGMGVLADQILRLLFPSYSEGGMLLKIGAASIIFLALSQIVTGILQGIGKVHIPAVNALIGSLAKIPVNYFLIAMPGINVAGAVISTTVCYSVASGLNLIALVRHTGVAPDIRGAFIKPLYASIIMSLCCYVIYNVVYILYPSNSIATICAIFSGIIIYILAMALMKGFKPEDLKQMPLGGKMQNFLEKCGLI